MRRLLERARIEVFEAPGGEAALRSLTTAKPDVVLLDVTMPGLDGWAVLDRIRQLAADLPVIMLTARDMELEKVRGLRAGADDYVTKPFGAQELLARVEGVLRRRPPRETSADELSGTYDDGLILVDLINARATANGTVLRLTPLQLRLLGVLVGNAGRLLSPEQILELAWGMPGEGLERVKVHVGQLRARVRDQSGVELPLETVRGFGYRYNGPDSESTADS